MVPATTFSGRRVALFGLGGSGLATARALKAGGAAVVAYDDNPESVAKAAAEGIETADLSRIDWDGFAACVLSPGVPLTHPKPHWTVDLARTAGVEIIGDIEIFCRERRAHAPDCPFIAITGTNGKSTTTALIAHVLKSAGRDVQMGGNIGTAILSLEPPAPRRHYVVECSSYQIDLAPSLYPTAGILLNVSPDHLDRHGTMQHYAAVKERLVAGADRAIIGIDDPHAALIAERLAQASAKVTLISKRQPVQDGIYAQGSMLMLAENGSARPLIDLAEAGALRGAHNAQNAAAAVAACRSAGLGEDEIVAGLKSFPGLKHRMQPVARRGRVLFVNDSKATNADAAAPALSSFTGIHWIAGGLAKDGGISTLTHLFDRIDRAYLIGDAAPVFAATLGNEVPFEIAGTLDKAVAHAAREAATSDAAEPVVLLSPACASFDQYKNFELRGEAFLAALATLEGIEMLVTTNGSD